MANAYFKINSLANRLLSCFHFLAIMNKAARNMVSKISVWFPDIPSLDLYLEVSLLDHKITDFLDCCVVFGI